jgi:hypothetical protein
MPAAEQSCARHCYRRRCGAASPAIPACAFGVDKIRPAFPGLGLADAPCHRDRSGSASIRDVYELHTMMVVATSAEKGRTVPVEAITSAFLLSPAEARLASSLCAGLTPAEYAVATGLSRNTVRKSARRGVQQDRRGPADRAGCPYRWRAWSPDAPAGGWR